MLKLAWTWAHLGLSTSDNQYERTDGWAVAFKPLTISRQLFHHSSLKSCFKMQKLQHTKIKWIRCVCVYRESVREKKYKYKMRWEYHIKYLTTSRWEIFRHSLSSSASIPFNKGVPHTTLSSPRTVCDLVNFRQWNSITIQTRSRKVC